MIDDDDLRTRLRNVLATHPDPACDAHPDGDIIQCGWKAAYRDVVSVLRESLPPPLRWETTGRPVEHHHDAVTGTLRWDSTTASYLCDYPGCLGRVRHERALRLDYFRVPTDSERAPTAPTAAGSAHMGPRQSAAHALRAVASRLANHDNRRGIEELTQEEVLDVVVLIIRDAADHIEATPPPKTGQGDR